MFGNLRGSAPLFVLHKQDPRVEIGEVISVSQPQPQYNVAYQNGLMQPPKTCVDVRIKVNDQTIDLQKLPSEQSIADCNGMVVSENKDAIINEVAAMAKISQSVLDSMDRHRDIVERCNQLLEELNPEVRREAERTKELNDLRSEVADLKGMLAQLLNSNNKGE
ncbi:MAG: hypothetical protein MJZ98_07310 [Paludibacteraceae bacterium]|nr:hypothetical protein [Paludibacteraceae bacterium]